MNTTYTELQKPIEKTRIRFYMETPEDWNTTERPDQRQDGYWPSKDPNNDGYIGDMNLDRFEEFHQWAVDRMAAWERGEWHYMGVRAVAHILIPCGNGSAACYELKSPGIWGIESDSDQAYILEVYEEQKHELMEHIKAMHDFEVVP